MSQIIALILRVNKNLLIQCLNPTTNRELPDLQVEFYKGRGTHGHIANLCWMKEKAKGKQKKTHCQHKNHRQ